jgi:hypothetical protein
VEVVVADLRTVWRRLAWRLMKVVMAVAWKLGDVMGEESEQRRDGTVDS